MAQPPRPEAVSPELPQGQPAGAPLDDVMLAMDVVDNLRHADRLVERELGSDERDLRMKERLRDLYAAQGIDVPEHILDEGVAALRENRFVYTPRGPGLGRSLALIWVRRGRLLRILALCVGVVAAVAGGWYFGLKLPAERQAAEQAKELTENLPRQVRTELDRILQLSKIDSAKEQARSLAAAADAAIRAGDAPSARERLARLAELRTRLEQSYVLRIVSKSGQPSGVWRVPRVNPSGRNYYILVEALDDRGRPVTLNVTSEEDNKTAQTSVFGIRVDERTFNRVRADKQDDGIIENNRFGEKEVGTLVPHYNFPTLGGTILEW